MSLTEGKYPCVYCGALLDIPRHSKLVVKIEPSSEKHNLRTLIFDGEVFHSCEISAAEPLLET